MATEPNEPAQSRTYPVIPESTWWALRKQFQERPPTRVVVDEEYVIDVLGYANKASASNVIRPLKRIGLIGEDGKPKELAWRWRQDEEYAAVCQEIMHAMYPPALTETLGDPNTDRSRVETWFARTTRVTAGAARQYASFYMLLLAADPSQQNVALSPKTPRTLKASTAQANPAKIRSIGSRARSADAAPTPKSQAGEAQHEDTSEQPQAPRARHLRGFEPMLNINIQIHIPADASSDQIEQIFKSMAKHLWQRQDEAVE